MKTALASPFRHQRHYSWKEFKDGTLSRTGVKDYKGLFHWPYFYAILPCSSRMALHLVKSFSVLFITDLNIALLVERSLNTAISYISSAWVTLECWQNLSKLTNQRVYQILVYWNDLFLSFPTGVLSLPLATLFYFFARCFLWCALTNWTPGRGQPLSRCLWEVQLKIHNVTLCTVTTSNISLYKKTKASIHFVQL